jgi:hypothetical protein
MSEPKFILLLLACAALGWFARDAVVWFAGVLQAVAAGETVK